MKRTLLSFRYLSKAIGIMLIVILFGQSGKAQYVTIPDPRFVTFLQQQYPSCMSGNQMDTTCAAIINEDTVVCYSLGIMDLEGIQYFDNLKDLECWDNTLTSIPALPHSLTRLMCFINMLTSLPELPSSLIWLSCGYGGFIPTLPALPDSLRYLECAGIGLTSLPELPPSLSDLLCHNNNLTSLPALPDSMGQLLCHDNPGIKCLPPLRKFWGSQPNSFDISNTGIRCLPNLIQHPGVIPAIDTMPICDLFNANGCEVSWNIFGSVYHDGSGDCIRQSSEKHTTAVKMNLYESGNLVQSGFFLGGNYSFDTDFSTYTVATDTVGLPFIHTCPPSGDTAVTITAQDSMKLDIDFGWRCKPGFDVGAKFVYGDLFRPARNTPVYIGAGDIANAYGSSCAGTVPGVVTVAISGPAQYISPAPGALTPDMVSGNTLTYYIADYDANDFFRDFNIIVRTDTFAQAGQFVCFTVSVSPTFLDNDSTNNVLTQCFLVRASYDPNDKQVYPDGDISPEENWLTYTIRFQNTGNDTAIHIQIIDTLDSNVDVAGFKILSYSHDNITMVKGRIVQFNFPNIMLPDSHTNELLSHGYIQYKVKLNGNLPIGTKIENTAYIYFDFNEPVVTNTTTNTIVIGAGLSPFSEAEGPEVRIFPNPATRSLTVFLSGSKEATITITNLLGETMFQGKSIGGRAEIDISQWPQGMYFVNQQKFVKQ